MGSPETLHSSSRLTAYRYPLLCGFYLAITGAAFYRIYRQPYSTSIKWEQYETVFKGTTLAAALAGLVMSGGVNKRRSQIAQT